MRAAPAKKKTHPESGDGVQVKATPDRMPALIPAKEMALGETPKPAIQFASRIDQEYSREAIGLRSGA
jgi:hypothetical protein